MKWVSVHKEIEGFSNDDLKALHELAKKSVSYAANLFRVSRFTAWSISDDHELTKWITKTP